MLSVCVPDLATTEASYQNETSTDTIITKLLSMEGGPPWMCTYAIIFTYICKTCSCGHDLDLMTLVYALDLDILLTKNEVCRSRLSKVRARTGHTDRQTDVTESITTLHLQVVKNECYMYRTFSKVSKLISACSCTSGLVWSWFLYASNSRACCWIFASASANWCFSLATTSSWSRVRLLYTRHGSITIVIVIQL